MIGHVQAIAQLQAVGGLPDMDISVVKYFNPTLPGDYGFMAHDDNADDGSYGFGRTPLDAIIDLLDQKEEGRAVGPRRPRIWQACSRVVQP